MCSNIGGSVRRLMCLLVRQNFSEKCEKMLNSQINMELKACHQYLAMAYHFDRSDIAAPNVFKFFQTASMEERSHAELIMKYMNKRGGAIKLTVVPEPKPSFANIREALVEALDMEKEVNQSLLELHTLATTENDPSLCDFIEANFLQEQVDGIKILADQIRQLERAQDDIGEHIFEKFLDAGMHSAGNSNQSHA